MTVRKAPKEEEKSSTPPGRFPVSPELLTKPVFDLPSLYNSTPEESKMGHEGGAASRGPTAPAISAAPVLAGPVVPKLNITILMLYMFSGTKEDLELKAFDN